MRKHRLRRVFLGPIASVVFLSLLAVGLGASSAAAEFFACVLAASSSDVLVIDTTLNPLWLP
jgi:hypothetical protein